MERLGELGNGEAAEAALGPMVGSTASGSRRSVHAWGAFRRNGEKPPRSSCGCAGLAASRIEDGIAALAKDPDALDAFRVANRAVARALRKRLKIDKPAWRAFQLAFVLLNLPGLADPRDSHRETVDLLFFPTGGGKTEAYLGLAAFAIVLRRLRHPGGRASPVRA